MSEANLKVQTTLDNLDTMISSGLGSYESNSVIIESVGTTSQVEEICTTLNQSVTILQEVSTDFGSLINTLGDSSWTGPHAEEVKTIIAEMREGIDSIEPCIQSFMNWSKGYSEGLQEIDANHSFNQ